MASFHGKLKNWLITLGEDNGYEAWTTDEEDNVEFSKIRNIKVDYRPDVVWKNKKTREKVFFEISSLKDDYRKIVGQVFLASQVENFSKIYMIRRTEHKDKWKNIESFMRLAFKKDDGIFKDHKAYQPRFILCERSLKEDDIKEEIVRILKEENWIK